MHRLALAATLAVALAAPAAQADDHPRDHHERGADKKELRQDRRELKDDRHDLARVEALQARLEALRARPSPGALADLDADVARELAAEGREGRHELARDTREVRRDQAERTDRRELADDERDRRAEVAQLRRVEDLRRAWAEVRGRGGPAAWERRRAILADLAALARWELRGDRREWLEDRRELREDRREDRR
jgi:hypothetical protein